MTSKKNKMQKNYVFDFGVTVSKGEFLVVNVDGVPYFQKFIGGTGWENVRALTPEEIEEVKAL